MAGWLTAFNHRPWGLLLPPQWLLAAGFAMAGWWLHPGWWVIGAGVHLGLCALTAPLLGPAPADPERVWQERRRGLLGELETGARAAQDEVERHAAAIARLLTRHGADPAATQADGIAQLSWQHLRLLAARTGAEAVLRGQADAGSLEQEAQGLRERLGLQALLLTRSEEGMSLFEPDRVSHVKAQVREVADVTGAGDTVIATMALMLACGLALEQAMEIANRAGGLVVAKFGTATVSYEELFA